MEDYTVTTAERPREPAAPDGEQGRSRRSNLGATARRAGMLLGPLVLFVVLWEVVVAVTGIERLVPPPTVVASAAWQLVETGALQQHVFVSLRRALVGFVIAGSAGIVVGLITGRVGLVRMLFEPLIQLFRPIPAIAWVPFSILWFGVGEVPKIFVIFMGVFFPVWVNVHLGARGIQRRYIEVAQNVGIGRVEQFYRIVFPATLPHIIAGLRVGMAVAFILLVAAELTGTSVGLGALISLSHTVFRVDRMVVGMVMLGVLGATADFLFARAVRRISYWDED